MMSVRYTKEKTVAIHGKIPQLQISCAWKQGLIIVVWSTVECIIVHIYVTSSLKQLHLVFVSEVCKEFHCFLRPYLMSSERDVCIYNLMHS